MSIAETQIASRRGAVRLGAPEEPPTPPSPLPHSAKESLWARHGQLICAVVAGLLLLAAKIIGWTLGEHISFHICVAVAFALGFYYGGRAALGSLREKKLDINLLMVLGAVLAIFVGSEMEGALLLFLFTLSGALEHYAMQRTHAALESLMKLFPKEAIVLNDDGSQKRVPLEALTVGNRVLVKPGENVPADGDVLEGTSSVDESAITGEFMPREKSQGDGVYAGTMNKAGRLVVRVSRPVQDTTLAKIIHLVSKASEEKAPVERLFDRVGTAYTAAVLLASTVACLAMAFFFDVPWLSVYDHGAVVQTGAFYRAIALLIVASPCALIISTPVVILSAIASCARRGIILKGGRHLESLAAMKALVFDKTGTLTTGQVRLAGVEIVDAANPSASRDGDGQAPGASQHCATTALRRTATDRDTLRRRLLQIAASLESNSTHPLAASVVRAATAEGLEPLPVTDFVQEAGAGIRGMVAEQVCIIGSPALLQSLCHTRTVTLLTQRLTAAHAAGETAVVLFHAGNAAILRFCDTIRPEAPAVVAAFHKLGVRPLVMLTGDNHEVARAVGRQLGLDEVRAQLLPEQKLGAVAELVKTHGAVGMVGDGINDAPALARATVGIAMGGIGSDAAMQAADVVLLSDAVERLPWLVVTARRARRVMAQNLAFAITVILVLAVFSLFGMVKLPLGVIGHEGSTLLVVFNGLRLLLPSRT
jgi:Zn2+/Cd2+-exporting ATPase